MEQRTVNPHKAKLMTVLNLLSVMNIKNSAALYAWTGISMRKLVALLPETERETYADFLSEYADLPDALACTMMNFVKYVALKSKSTCEGGQHKDGNAKRMRDLQSAFGADAEDIYQNIMMNIFKNLDTVLAKSAEAQIPYCFAVCNSGVVDTFRSCSKKDCKNSLQDTRHTPNAKDDSKEMHEEDFCTSGVSTEDWAIAKVTCCQEMLHDLRLLRSSDEAFVYLCMYDGLRPRHIFEQYAELGKASLVVRAVCGKYGIRAVDLPTAVNKPLSKIFSAALRSMDEKAVCNKISDIKYGFPDDVKARVNDRIKTFGAA